MRTCLYYFCDKKFKPKNNVKNNFIDGEFEDIEDDNDKKI